MLLRLVEYEIKKIGKRKGEVERHLREIHEFAPVFRQDGCLTRAHSRILSDFINTIKAPGKEGVIDIVKEN